MLKTHKPDYILLVITAILVFYGLVMIASAGIVLSNEIFHQSYYYLKNQLTKGILVGVILGSLAFFIPYRLWRKFSVFLLVITVILLIAVFIPKIGSGSRGVSRWINLAFFSFQPAEILKLTFLIYLAAWLDSRSKNIGNLKHGFIPFLIIVSAIGVLVLKQPDIGTFAVVAASAIAVFFLAGARLSHIFLIFIIGVLGLFILINLYSYASNRWQVFVHPELEPQGIGYQINQTILSLGSGGMFGVGLGQSRQKYNYLPEPVSDSIVAVIGEELGFIGLFVLISLFLAFAYRGFKISRNAPDKFATILSGGITSLILIQVFINISAICGLIPLTGITLPFISYGGSSLAVSLTGVGILLNISKYT